MNMRRATANSMAAMAIETIVMTIDMTMAEAMTTVTAAATATAITIINRAAAIALKTHTKEPGK
jgi:hypothetical protein